MKLKRKLVTEADKKFWGTVDRVADTVRTWPDWKKVGVLSEGTSATRVAPPRPVPSSRDGSGQKR